MRKGRENRSIQSRLIMIMAGMMLLVLAVNLYVFRQTRTMVQTIDSVFVSNSTIVKLSDTLDKVGSSMYDYLSTRGSSSLEDFYRYEEDLREITTSFNDQNTSSPMLMLEKNIREMSEAYLEAAEKAIQAKRGRNVEEYRRKYADSKRLNGYIDDAVYALNSRRFAQNSRNYQMLQNTMGVLEASSMVMILTAFVMAMFLAVMLIRAIFGPLKELAGAADRVAAGDFDVDVRETGSGDEIAVVTHAFRKMLFSIREYIERQRASMEKESRMKENALAMQAHLKEAQLNFLQAQINPHFLFNSLNAGSQLAALEGADRTQDYLGRMADFFRYDVQKTGGSASLEEELELVDNYIYILNVRFSGDIHFDKILDQDIRLSDITMPSMTLQPIVENAVQHGIHDDHEHGRIWLYVEMVDGEDAPDGQPTVMVTVSDNGAGMTADQIMCLMESGRGKTDGGGVPETDGDEMASGSLAGTGKEETAGVAMGNVMARLTLYYGREGLLRVSSDGPGLGTQVTVFLPLR
ncbi:sensor histidine kinase [Porcincola intestinalis]|uniref:HAMP domain-containing protein n=1 Tax=Porcincola intestinalis TaxID=2606632 RepID=A0A6L5X584_9FIRM|nr:histidine kinase [Porcincola intestinalis]MSS14637.1 HAMP domain-containing protein [Porcincola intestinalis]